MHGVVRLIRSHHCKQPVKWKKVIWQSKADMKKGYFTKYFLNTKVTMRYIMHILITDKPAVKRKRSEEMEECVEVRFVVFVDQSTLCVLVQFSSIPIYIPFLCLLYEIHSYLYSTRYLCILIMSANIIL